MSKILVELKQSLASMHKSPDIHAAGIAYSIYIPRAIENIEQLESENARLRKAIEDAPCSLGCVYHSCNQSPPCNCHALKHSDFCWKSKALGEQK